MRRLPANSLLSFAYITGGTTLCFCAGFCAGCVPFTDFSGVAAVGELVTGAALIVAGFRVLR
jgi:hypothetical protein